ncbi:hypothetical protein GTQ99_15165 [Kineococcus sp. T13]|uniref:hypothetical protein n=1 Tax=Kineococcus vitellinus TaxID=2696565 RepID=UPI0014123F75|nr:hypothetical protein [Kineococcus vitellinus]NAZ76750.1 hypothetical protein [Kineococcus vitellinus]
MSDGPQDAPVPREAPSPPGADLPAVVDEIDERVGLAGREAAECAREEDGGGDPSGDVVPDPASADGADGAEAADGVDEADQPADPTLRTDGGQGGADGTPVSEPTG